jgi:hypothetical protein
MPPPRQEQQQTQEAPPAPPPPPPVENDDVAMDQINLSVVPEMFWKDVYKAANKVREWSKKQSQSWNQHLARRFNSITFPWQTTHKNWQMPEIKQERLSITEYLLPFYARVKMFLPDRTMGHHLPGGRMPFKWHGYEGECCVRVSVFSPSGPRACHASDG